MPKANVKALRVALVEPLPCKRAGLTLMLERGGRYRVVLRVACPTCGPKRKRPLPVLAMSDRTPM